MVNDILITSYLDLILLISNFAKNRGGESHRLITIKHLIEYILHMAMCGKILKVLTFFFLIVKILSSYRDIN